MLTPLAGMKRVRLFVHFICLCNQSRLVKTDSQSVHWYSEHTGVQRRNKIHRLRFDDGCQLCLCLSMLNVCLCCKKGEKVSTPLDKDGRDPCGL